MLLVLFHESDAHGRSHAAPQRAMACGWARGSVVVCVPGRLATGIVCGSGGAGCSHHGQDRVAMREHVNAKNNTAHCIALPGGLAITETATDHCIHEAIIITES